MRRPWALGASIVASTALLAGLMTDASITPVGRVTAVLTGFNVADDMSAISLHFSGANGLVLQSNGDSALVADDTGTVPLDLPGGKHLNRQRIDIVSNPLGNVGWIWVEFYSKRYYASLGTKSEGVVQVITDLARAPYGLPSEDGWQAPPSPLDDMPVDPAWEDLVPAHADGDPADLRAVAGRFMAFLDAENVSAGRPLCSDATPSAVMRSLITEGMCYAWCTGESKMFRDLLRTAGYPARAISLSAPRVGLSDGTIVQTSEQHASLEVFDEGRWRWIDPTFRVWEARGPDGTALSLRGVFEAMSNPATRNEVEFDLMLPGTTAVKTVTYGTAPSDLLIAFARYITTDKLLAPETP